MKANPPRISAPSWRPAHVDVQIADFLAQCVPVQAQNVGGLQLVATRGRQRARDQRPLDLADQPIVDTGRRQGAVMGAEIAVDVALDGAAEIVVDRSGSAASVGARDCSSSSVITSSPIVSSL